MKVLKICKNYVALRFLSWKCLETIILAKLGLALLQFRFFPSYSPDLISKTGSFVRQWNVNHWNPTKIARKLPEQEPILFTYFENDANRAAVGFRFWRENRNRETILFKMMCELLKSTLKKERIVLFLCTTLSTQLIIVHQQLKSSKKLNTSQSLAWHSLRPLQSSEFENIKS